MRRRLVIALMVMLLAGIVAAALWGVWPREPRYQGRSLSAWLDDLTGKAGDRLRAEEAIRQIGTNAVPFLAARLALADDPSWRLKLAEVASQQSLIKIRFVPASDRRFQALAACDALGPMAKDALPSLEKLLYHYPYTLDAAMVMGDIGPEAIPGLTKGLTNNYILMPSYCRTALAVARCPPPLSARQRDGDFRERLNGFHLKAAPTVDYESPPRRFVRPGEF